MNISLKQLKFFLAPDIKKLGLTSLASKLGKFSLFNNFFLDLANFWDLDNFLPFEFSDLNNFRIFDNIFDFLAYFIPLLLTPTLFSPSVTAYFLEIDLFDDIVIFSMKVNRVAILLKR